MKPKSLSQYNRRKCLHRYTVIDYYVLSELFLKHIIVAICVVIDLNSSGYNYIIQYCTRFRGRVTWYRETKEKETLL